MLIDVKKNCVSACDSVLKTIEEYKDSPDFKQSRFDYLKRTFLTIQRQILEMNESVHGIE